MSLLSKIINQMNEDAAGGAVSAGSIAANFSGGFEKGRGKTKMIRRKKIKKIFKEDKEYDQQAVIAQIKNAEKHADSNKDVIGFALEDDNNNIVKVFVKKDQAEEFESALTSELEKNRSEEHSHREIAEIIYELKNDFDIVNTQMATIPEDEEEIEEVEGSEEDLEIDKDDLEDGKGSGIDDLDLDDKDSDGDDMLPGSGTSGTSDDSGAKSALDAVIDMMKADAEARQADAEAKKKESEAKIAALNTQAAEAQVKKSEEVMDMEAHYKKQSDKDKESKQLTKLAQYRHELDGDDTSADTDYVETDLPTEEEEEVKVSGKLLNAALTSLLRDRSARN